MKKKLERKHPQSTLMKKKKNTKSPLSLLLLLTWVQWMMNHCYVHHLLWWPSWCFHLDDHPWSSPQRNSAPFSDSLTMKVTQPRSEAKKWMKQLWWRKEEEKEEDLDNIDQFYCWVWWVCIYIMVVQKNESVKSRYIWWEIDKLYETAKIEDKV